MVRDGSGVAHIFSPEDRRQLSGVERLALLDDSRDDGVFILSCLRGGQLLVDGHLAVHFLVTAPEELSPEPDVAWIRKEDAHIGPGCA